MQFKDIRAEPHPDGNRIDLTWIHPEPVAFPSIRVVRSIRTHPTLPDLTLLLSGRRGMVGEIVAETGDLTYTANDAGERVYQLSDVNCQGETVYYYTLFPYVVDVQQALYDPHNTATAIATSPYDMASEMYRQLPAIYHRYDTQQVGDGQLRRFLDLPGQQLGQLLSFARAMLELHNIDRVDGRLLPLLADWIGWQTNYRVGVATQRNEIRYAPYIYKTTGIIPTVEAAIKRVLGWESQTKEFIHNIAVSNNAEVLNIWAAERDTANEWVHYNTPLSLDFAYQGRPAVALSSIGTCWLVYHTLRNNRWDIWFKQLLTFSFTDMDLVSAFLRDLRTRQISVQVQTAFADHGFSISLGPYITILEPETEVTGRWFIIDDDNEITYTIHWRNNMIFIDHWTPSEPLTVRAAEDMNPSAAFVEDTLVVFWHVFVAATETWRIDYALQTSDGTWSAVQTFESPGTNVPRRSPYILVINNEMWLFWTEFVGSRWQMVYKVFGDPTLVDPTGPHAIGNAIDYTLLTTPSLVYQSADDLLWLFWSQRENSGRRRIVYQIKASSTTGAGDWGPVTPLNISPAPDTAYDETDPQVIVNPANQIELFWASNRDRSWSIWSSTFDSGTTTWATPDNLTGNPYTQRSPLPVFLENRLLLLYRSNASIPYSSPNYGATTTLDNRYVGSTTVDTRNVTKTTLREKFEDFQTYTYDVGQDEEDYYSANTVGIYLDPATEDEAVVFRSRKLIREILQRFLPIGVRVVFIIPVISRDWVYTYDFPERETQHVIGEVFFDSVIPETYPGIEDTYEDNMVGWIWIYSWSVTTPNGRSVEVMGANVVHRHYRTWHVGLSTGE